MYSGYGGGYLRTSMKRFGTSIKMYILWIFSGLRQFYNFFPEKNQPIIIGIVREGDTDNIAPLSRQSRDSVKCNPDMSDHKSSPSLDFVRILLVSSSVGCWP